MLNPSFPRRKALPFLWLASVLAAAFVPVVGLAAPPVAITDFGAKADSGGDAAPAVRAALAQCLQTHAEKLVFPPGRFDFWPNFAGEKSLFITNNDPGLRRVAFDLSNAENLEIDGGGAHFIFHGNVLPFVLDHSRHVVLRNFSIDWARPFHSEVKVLKTDATGVDVSIAEQFPYKIDHGVLAFLDEYGKLLPPIGDILEYDPQKKETAFLVWDYFTGPALRAHAVAPGQVHLEDKITATPGNVLVIQPADRLYPAITLSDATQIRVEDVTIYHAGGMGVVAQRSRDITLERIKVTPPPDGKRILSLTADATHFANCSGQITMENCLFENQMDDATNIHGIYCRVSHQLAANDIVVELVHPQQRGFDFLTPGIKVELVRSDSLNTYAEATVKAAERLNDQYTRITLDAVPGDLRLGDVVAAVDTQPDVRIAHCDIGRNRARGILLGSRGKIVIEDNVFHTPGAAILLEGDGRFWFEQAGVRDLTIRRNIFNNCNYGVWGNAAIQVGAGIIKEQRANSRYNRSVVIEDNVFHVFDPRLVNAYSVDGLTFRRNRVEPSADYPPQHQDARPFEIVDSDHVSVDEK